MRVLYRRKVQVINYEAGVYLFRKINKKYLNKNVVMRCSYE